MSEKVAWGILGTGKIARVFAQGVSGSQTGQLVAVGSRTQESADAFGEALAVSRRHGSYEALLADPEVQAVYIATPHPLHAEWAIKAAEAGKHILCEKPLALNHAEAMAVIEAARRADRFLMEAFMYRCHPQTAALARVIREGAVGQVRLIQATFSFDTPEHSPSRALRHDLAGGGILDVGCYCTSMARLLAGAATGRAFAEPIEVKGCGHLGATSRVDEYAIASFLFPGGIVAELITGVKLNGDNVVRVVGSAGSIEVRDPWVPGRNAGRSAFTIQAAGAAEPHEISVETTEGLYALEADTVGRNLAERQAPEMTWQDSLGNMQTLDRWRASIGLIYDMEQPEAQLMPITRRPLAVRCDAVMRYGAIAGVEKPVSRLVMGVDNQTAMPHAAAMFDDFFEHGGTCFDTAYIYQGGACERTLGQWIKNRALRAQVIVLGKGAHTPFCTPAHLTAQLEVSLDRLQTSYVDIYMMHRDNLEVPVGEFIEVLNDHQKAGRIHAFGVSNWTIERVQEAQEYARQHGLHGFAALSNNFSLAHMVEPPWAGCVSVWDRAARSWLTNTQMPLMPWSSQARGFFSGRAAPDAQDDAELVRCWYSEDNFARLRRAEELAQQRGVTPIVVALAYVLAQPFPTFPLIGPRSLAETRSSLQALTLPLTHAECAWLDGVGQNEQQGRGHTPPS